MLDQPLPSIIFCMTMEIIFTSQLRQCLSPHYSAVDEALNSTTLSVQRMGQRRPTGSDGSGWSVPETLWGWAKSSSQWQLQQPVKKNVAGTAEFCTRSSCGSSFPLAPNIRKEQLRRDQKSFRHREFLNKKQKGIKCFKFRYINSIKPRYLPLHIDFPMFSVCLKRIWSNLTPHNSLDAQRQSSHRLQSHLPNVPITSW